MQSDLSVIDHLVYAAPDLQLGVDAIQRQLDVTVTSGGRHPEWGTANALLSLGPSTYLEIIGPDPEQPDFAGKRIFQIDSLRAPRLVTWAAKGQCLERLSEIELADDERIGQAYQGARERPDGGMLEWVLTDPRAIVCDGLAPFFIDWGDSPHPAASVPGGAELIDMHVTHPSPERVRETFTRLGLNIAVEKGNSPAIIATLNCAGGTITLK